MPRPKIKLFWDLATCPISTHTSVPEVVKNVRRFTSDFGIVTSIKAYWDKNKFPSADHSILTVMPSMGINLIDCSSMQGYADDALSKMLSVDVVISAMDNLMCTVTPEEDIIMIFSGDRSVLYPISLLLFRNYTVFLAVPDNDQDVQQFQATRVFNWHREVLGSDPSSKPVYAPVAASLKSPGWVVNGTHIPQLSLEPTSIAMSSSSNGVSPRSMPSIRKLPSQSTTTISSSPALSSSRQDGSLPSLEPQVTRAPSALSLASNARSLTAKSPNDFEAVEHHAGLAIIDDLWAQPGVSDPENLYDAGDGTTDDWTASGSGWNVGGSWEATGSSWVTDPDPAPTHEVKVKPTPRTMGQIKPENPQKQQGKVAKETTLSTLRNGAEGSLHDPPLSVFDPLLQILRGTENGSMKRAQLGEHLAKQKGLYQSAGVTGFGEFIAIALRKNLVTLRGIDGHQQVKLKKK